jgi:hypothetical protein
MRDDPPWRLEDDAFVNALEHVESFLVVAMRQGDPDASVDRFCQAYGLDGYEDHRILWLVDTLDSLGEQPSRTPGEMHAILHGFILGLLVREHAE